MASASGWRPRLLGVVAAVVCVLGASAALAEPAVLYDGAAAGETLDDQGFLYVSDPLRAAAVVSYADGGTTLDSTAEIRDLAGFIARPGLVPALDRAAGFRLRFTAQVVGETHLTADRAGLSLVLIANDLRGIELGLWEDEVWAQNDGAALFTHGEGAALDLTSRPVAFELAVRGDSYTLTADGATVLGGPVRDYTASEFPFYSTPNFIFLGDNSTRASAVARILFVSVEGAGGEPTPTATPPTATPAPEPRGDEQLLFLPLLTR